ncbi:hypothetical protein PHYNN_239 [Pantoea phage Phynn]|nr:hypothetical protein PHYNN_239 [Pantoea phage Phynn]
MASTTNAQFVNRSDATLAKEIQERQAFDALQLSAVDQENRRAIWQKVFLESLPNQNRIDRIEICSNLADKAVDAYDKKFCR